MEDRSQINYSPPVSRRYVRSDGLYMFISLTADLLWYFPCFFCQGASYVTETETDKAQKVATKSKAAKIQREMMNWEVGM